MYLHIQKDQWPKVLEEMFRVLKPGGYIELIESDMWHHNSGPVQIAFQTFYKEQCKLLDLDLEIADSLDAIIVEKGFELVEKRTLDIPIGEWATEPGKLNWFEDTFLMDVNIIIRIKTIWFHKQGNSKGITQKQESNLCSQVGHFTR